MWKLYVNYIIEGGKTLASLYIENESLEDAMREAVENTEDTPFIRCEITIYKD